MLIVSVVVEQRGLDDPALLRAVDGDEHALGDVGRRCPQKPARLEPEEAVLAGERRRTAEHHHRVLAERPSARCIARSEPSASPSGLSCEVTTKRSCRRSAATTALPVTRCIVVSVGGCQLVDQVRHADAVLDRAIVDELEPRESVAA